MKTNYTPGGPTIKDMLIEDRPREKMMSRGFASLTDAELLALILSTGHKSVSAVELCRQVLNASGGFAGLASCSPEELMRIKGIGQAKALTITAAFELGRRREQIEHKPEKILNSQSAGNYLLPKLRDLNHEVFYVLFLARNNAIKAEKMISTGGTSSTIVDVKMIFKEAIQQLCASVILAHNHPSGGIQPSQADVEVTKQMVFCGKMLNIPVVDHIIVGQDKYFSFADEGML
jgi:DNA repair protein RadC